MLTSTNGQKHDPKVFALPQWIEDRIKAYGMHLKDALCLEKMTKILSDEELVFFYGTIDPSTRPLPNGVKKTFSFIKGKALLDENNFDSQELKAKAKTLAERIEYSFTTICGDMSAEDILKRYVSIPDMEEYVVVPTLSFVEDHVFCIRYSAMDSSQRTGALQEFYSNACKLIYTHYGFPEVAQTQLFYEYLKLGQVDDLLIL